MTIIVRLTTRKREDDENVAEVELGSIELHSIGSGTTNTPSQTINLPFQGKISQQH